MSNKSSGRAGFTLVEIMVVTTIIGLFVAIAIPNFIIARSNAQTKTCINNLRQIDSAKQQWAIEASPAPSTTPLSTDIQPYLGRGAGSITAVVCPQDPAQSILTSYLIGGLGIPPTCAVVPAKHALP
jgi:prepilin-type N-terminal cleavage/methylation domain-containing protein